MPARDLRRVCVLIVAVWLAAALGLAATDPRPIVGPGATRDDVINAYGWPTGLSQSGTKEILNYPQGQVTLSRGKVERVDFDMSKPWPPPRPRPGTPTASTGKPAADAIDFWETDFATATREAARRNARVLALFTGSDWSPASKRFLDEVAFHLDFVTSFTGDFVFLRLDLPSRAPIDPKLKEQNTQLRERYGVTTYPALLVLSPAGTQVAVVDLMTERAGATYRERVIEAVREVRDQLIARPPAPDPISTTPAEETTPTAEPASPEPAGPASASAPGVASSLSSARVLVLGAIGAGVLVAALLIWWLWGGGSAARSPESTTSISMRIADAAGGLPSTVQMLGWSRERLALVVAGLAEADGFLTRKRTPGGEVDVELIRAADAKPGALVVCVPGNAVVSGKRVRELFGTMTVEGVPAGWLVAPGGFGHDAQAFARENGISLIDAQQLLTRLRDLPPLLLQKVMLRRD